MNILITQLGPKKADYIVECIKQLLFFNNKNIYLISNTYHKNLLKKYKLINKIKFFHEKNLIRDPEHIIFLNRTSLDKKWFQSFWLKTTERFFFINALAKKLKLINILHIETDNLLYANLDNIEKILEKKFNYLFALLNKNISYANILYFRSSRETNNFANFIYKNHNSFFFKKNLNDMNLITAFYKKFKSKKNSTFPISTKKILHNNRLSIKNNSYCYKNYDIFKGIFDAAPIGQIIDGVDYRIHKLRGPYVNKKYFMDASNLKIKFLKINQKKLPFIMINKNQKVPILNIHFHSKNLKKYTSY